MKSLFRSTFGRTVLAAGIVSLAGAGLVFGVRASAGSSTPVTWAEEPTTAAATPTTAAAPATTTMTPTTTTVVDTSLFMKNVNAFYNEWVELDSLAGGKELINQYVASPYGSTLNRPPLDYDQVLCAQNTPFKFSAGTPVVNGEDVTVKITTYWSDGSNSFRVTGDAKSGLITNISCPHN